MSKKTRSKDNSKRPQPLAHQRAQAHQSGGGSAKAGKDAQPSQPKQDKGDRGVPQG